MSKEIISKDLIENNILRRQKRKKQTAEIFTPPILVNEMLDNLPNDAWEEGKTYCDPACGNGNMLVEVLKRKLLHKHDPKTVLSTIYGCDIMSDNIKECRLRLLKIVSEHTNITDDIIKMALNNIVLTSLRRYEKGSLDYSFEFPDIATPKGIIKYKTLLKDFTGNAIIEN